MAMGLIILIMILSVIAILPCVWLRKPWAVAIWRNAKMVAVLYALIILLSGIVRLVFNWDDIYG
jgi:hypothetical protein